MGVEASRTFWSETERYHDLAESYEKHIQRYHPERVTSRRMCPCLKYTHWCGRAGTSVTYYRHDGPFF